MIIYKTTNLINDKIYIGQKSKHKKKEINSLEDLLETDYYGSSKDLKKDIKELGKENFKRELIEKDIYDRKELNERETYWNIFYNATNPEIGYNISLYTWPFFAGCHHTEEARQKMRKPKSEETKQKISKAKKGKSLSEQHKRKLRDVSLGENNHFYGKHHTDEAKQRMSESLKISMNKPETKQKLSEKAKERFENPENHPMFNKHHTEESKKKMSESQKEYLKNPENNGMFGKHHTEESKKKNSEANKGKKRSDEIKQRMSKIQKIVQNRPESKKKNSEANKGKKRSDETKKKMSDSQKNRRYFEYIKKNEIKKA